MKMLPSLSPALLAALSLFDPNALFGQQHALVKDIRTTPIELSSSPANYTVAGSTAYFTATTQIHGTELWKTDGSAAGTVLVKDIRTGTESSEISFPTNVGGEVR